MHPRNIVEGQVDWVSYDRVGDGRVHALMQRIHVKADETIPLAGAEVVVTVDGRELTARVAQPRGEPECPVPWDRLETKFRGLASGALGPARARRGITTVRAIEAEPTLPRWARSLRAGGRGR